MRKSFHYAYGNKRISPFSEKYLSNWFRIPRKSFLHGTLAIQKKYAQFVASKASFLAWTDPRTLLIAYID